MAQKKITDVKKKIITIGILTIFEMLIYYPSIYVLDHARRKTSDTKY